MSDEEDKKTPEPDSSSTDFDLDDIGWDDALAELEDELSDTEKAQTQLSEARPLYRPPTPGEAFAKREPRRPQPAELDDLPTFDDVDDDEEFESTKIAAIPQELIDSLVTDETAHKRPTKPPPLPPSRPGAELPEDGPPSVDLDLDGLLDGLDEETRVYPERDRPAPRTPTRSEAPERPTGGPRPFGARPPVGEGPGVRTKPPPAAENELVEPSAEARGGAPVRNDQSVVASFRPPRREQFPTFDEVEDDAETRVRSSSGTETVPDDDDFTQEPTRMVASPLAEAGLELDEPEPSTRVARSPLADLDEEPEVQEPTRVVQSPLADLEDELDQPEPTRIVSSPLLEAKKAASRRSEPPAPEEVEAKVEAEPAAEGPAAAEDDFEDAKTRMVTPPSEEAAAQPPSPSPPTSLKIPKPPPRGIPKPGASRPAGARPKLPPIPKPGSRPSVPKPKIPVPKPGRRPGPGSIPKPPGARVPPPPPRPKPPAPFGKIGKPGEAKPAASEPPPLPKPPAAKPATEPPKPTAPPPPPSQPAPAGPTPVPAAPAEAEPAAARPTPVPTAPAEAEPAAAGPTPVPAPAEPAGPEPAGGEKDELARDLDALLSADRVRSERPPAADDEEAEITLGAAEELETSEITLTDEEETAELTAAEPAEEEPELAVEEEAEVSIEVGEEDDDLDMAVVATSDEDWDDEDWEALEAAAEAQEAAEAEAERAASAPPRADDRGAAAARRSVRSRKPRDEHFPMVGDGPEALRLRTRLLENLAEKSQGRVRARLLVGAAEMAEQLGHADEAKELYVQALASDPTDLVALRALRRDAAARGHWQKLATLFEREAKLELGPGERASAWTAVAELNLGPLDDAEAAEKAALAALQAQPRSMAATIALAEARWRRGQAQTAIQGFEAARDVWDDPDARAALAVEEARVAEQRGDEAKARELYTWANDVDPEALDAWFGRARTSSRAEADPAGAVEALATIAAYCGGPLGEAILTRASRVATRIKKDPALGVRLLGEATGVLPLQARADAAAATGEVELELACLASWAGAAGGTDRALALVRTAELKAGLGDLDGAETALRDAARADGSLGTIRVVREVIARRSGDASRLVDATDSGGALAAAARLAGSRDTVDREHELLLEAIAEGAALVAADVIGLDVAANRADALGIEDALRRQADRVPPEQRIGSLLALVEHAIEREDLDAAERLLDESRKLAPGDPLALRPLGRLATRRGAEPTAAIWLEEAEAAEGSRAAFAATQAGRVLAAGGGDAVGAYRNALEAVPGYRPAAWALKPLAMELGDVLTLGEVYEQLAQTAAAPLDAARDLVRGALLRAEADPAGAAELLARAQALAPGDMVLISLQMRLAANSEPKTRAPILVQAAERASAPLARVYRIQAAQTFEAAEDPSAAAEQYLKVVEQTPDDPMVVEALDRAQLGADQTPRVAERRFAAVKGASSDEERTLALERLAELDLVYRHDPAAAVLSLQTILETAPGHLPTLRTLQRYYATQGRKAEAAEAVSALARHVQEGPDVTAHARLARHLLLSGEESTTATSDPLLLEVAPRADLDLWLAPRVLAAAQELDAPERAREAAVSLAELLGAPEERASSRVRAAELFEEVDPARSLELLREAVQASPTHPTAAEALARASEAAEDPAAAAEAYEKAGEASQVRSRAAALFYRAAELWEQVGDPDRARSALVSASERDVTHADVFDRLHRLLEEAGDKAALADLYQQRLSAGADDPELVELYVKQANLRTEVADYEGAKAALRSALALQPERLDALRSLAQLCLDDEDWRGAAEVLIRIARIRKEREELRWVFFTLGGIYDEHMPDPRRAEAAFRRVLKLFPNDLPAMERLAALYERQDQLPQAAQVLEDLAEREVDLEASRGHRLRLASIHERLGDARKAEQVLEAARKDAPTDLHVVRALADFYQRQNASNAMSMHLRRAVNDFRHALEADLSDASAWPGLVEVLRWSGKPDAASAAASAAQAVGISDIEMSKLVDARGAAPGAAARAASDTLDELLAPPELGAPARAVFKLAGEVLEKCLPFDVSAYRAERVDNRDTRIRPIALEIARWFRLSPVELYVTSAAPRVCVPVQSSPCILLIGSELLGITDDREKEFVLTRAFQIARARLSVVVRSQPQEVVALLGGLVQSYDPHHMPPGADPAHVAEAARRVAKNVGRKVANDLGPLVFEMAGRQGYDPSQLAMAASAWGNRVALVGSGSAPSAISALAKLSGERDLPTDPGARVTLLSRFAEASSLLRFAISDAHFEARERAGTGAG